MQLVGKVVLISGGASGIGSCCVEELLKYAVKGVVIADVIDCEEFVLNLNNKYGVGKVIYVKVDVSDKNNFEVAFKKTVETFGNIDILVNCAAIFDEIDWQRTIQVNLVGTINGCLLAVEYLPMYGSSTETYILNIASIVGLIPSVTGLHYSATKHGVIGLTRSYGFNSVIRRKGICVMALCPGATETPMRNSFHKVLFADGQKSTLPSQKPDVVGRSVVEVLEKPESGSIWVINDSKLFKMTLPTIETLKLLQ